MPYAPVSGVMSRAVYDSTCWGWRGAEIHAFSGFSASVTQPPRLEAGDRKECVDAETQHQRDDQLGPQGGPPLPRLPVENIIKFTIASIGSTPPVTALRAC